MKKIFILVTILFITVSLASCNFEDEKEFDIENPTRVAFLTLDILDILSDVGFEKTNIKEMGMLFKGEVDYLEEFNNDNVIDLGTHRALNYDEIDKLDPELIILGNRTRSFKVELEEKYPKAIIYDATHDISIGGLINTLDKNVEFLSSVFPNIKSDLENKFNTIKNDINELKGQNIDVSTLVIVLSGQEPRTNGKDSRYGILYKDFGFKVASEEYNSSDSHGQIISYEAILEINPIVIFVMDRSSTVGENEALDFDSFLNNTFVKETDAFANSNVFLLNGDAWYMTSGGFISARAMIKDVETFLVK
ncbi:MAG TPA: ABC transporter substrate-binding protein [Acholeplasmataceae bacterium]|nr:ABC transporter substrate-binding protein [Acholeplasmataceae bacterium]